MRAFVKFFSQRIFVADTSNKVSQIKPNYSIYNVVPWQYTCMYMYNVILTEWSVSTGIANALDLTDRILPRLTAHARCKPHLLHFPPYTREEIVAILRGRVGREGGGEVVVDKAAIEFCARKVSAVHGDLRKALDICRWVPYVCVCTYIHVHVLCVCVWGVVYTRSWMSMCVLCEGLFTRSWMSVCSMCIIYVYSMC